MACFFAAHLDHTSAGGKLYLSSPRSATVAAPFAAVRAYQTTRTMTYETLYGFLRLYQVLTLLLLLSSTFGTLCHLLCVLGQPAVAAIASPRCQMCPIRPSTHLGAPFQASSLPYRAICNLSDHTHARHTSFQVSDDDVNAILQYNTTHSFASRTARAATIPIHVPMSREESAQSGKHTLSAFRQPENSPHAAATSRSALQLSLWFSNPSTLRVRPPSSGAAGHPQPAPYALRRRRPSTVSAGTRLFRLAFGALRPERRRRCCCCCGSAFF